MIELPLRLLLISDRQIRCRARIAALQRWKKNMLLSMFAGTALYMLLVQMVF